MRKKIAVYGFLAELSDLCKVLLLKQDLVLICVTGKAGAGKSTFGKHVRKNGFGSFGKSGIAVIDDSVMSLDLFYVLNKRVRIKSAEKDELEPFLELLPKRKKVVFYVNTTPERRVSQADIILHLSLNDEDERLRRLKERGDVISETHFIDSVNAKKDISYKYYLSKKV